MDRLWFIHLLLFLIICSTFQARTFLDHLHTQKNESTNQTSTSNTIIINAATNFSTHLANSSTTSSPSTVALQFLITKANSYLYDGQDDEEVLDRVKRDPAPFVCKSKSSVVSVKQKFYF